MDRAAAFGAVVDVVKSDFASIVAKQGAVAVFVVIALLLIVVIIAYLVWRLYRTQLVATTALRNPRKLNNQKAYTYAAYRMPGMSVGQSYSVSFWLYLTDFQSTSQGKLLLMRTALSASTAKKGLSGTNPVVFLDKSINQMYVCIATTRATTSSSQPGQLTDLLNTSGVGAGNKWNYLVATVEYVPLQRWVQFVFTVQDNTLTMYQDSSIYTVQSLFDMVDATSSVPRPMFAACSGDLTIGNPVSKGVSSNATGFIARVMLFNYALTTQQVQDLYSSGPTAGNMMRGLGVPSYGVRSPVYRLDDEASGDGDTDGAVPAA